MMGTDGTVGEGIKTTIPIWGVSDGQLRRQGLGMGERGRTTILGAQCGRKRILEAEDFLGCRELEVRL